MGKSKAVSAFEGAKIIFAKTHLRQYGGLQSRIIALCDVELLERVLQEGDVTVDLKNYKSFYEGERVSEEEAVVLLKQAENANIVGEKSVSAAKKAFGGKSPRVKKVQGIPHLQIYKV